jgi:hypothetical protein
MGGVNETVGDTGGLTDRTRRLATWPMRESARWMMSSRDFFCILN